jgi:threonine/homoserine/homoserine lactone efflux protein
VVLVTSLLAGVVFGLALAAPPGPMNAVIAEESVLRGRLAGFRAGLGAMSADAVFLVLTALGVAAVVDRSPALRAVMVAGGGLLMLFFASGAARDALATGGSFAGDVSAGTEDGLCPRSSTVSDPDAGAPDGSPTTDGAGTGTETGGPTPAADSRGFGKAFVLALTNPYQLLFWLTVGVRLLDPGRLDLFSHTPYVGDALAGALVVTTGSPALVAGLFGGILVWIVGFPAALVAAGRRVDAFAPVVAGLSALVLAGFGALFLVDAAGAIGGAL